MPRGNRRGPENAGPMTGRALGYCVGNDRPGFAVDAAPQGVGRGFRRGGGPGFGRRFARGFGRGRGFGYGFAFNQEDGMNYNSAVEQSDFRDDENKELEMERLQNLTNALSNELESVKRQLDELKK